MYFTAHGRAIPCCIAPFSMRGYDGFTLGDATQQGLREIWNGPRYQAFRSALLSDQPPTGLCRLRSAVEPVNQWHRRGSRWSFPALNEEEAIGGVIAAVPPGRSMTSSSSTAPAPTDGRVAQAGRRPGPYPARARLRPGLPRRAPTRPRLRHPGVSRRRRQRLPGVDPVVGRADCRGNSDFVIGSRSRGKREQGSMTAISSSPAG